MKKTLVLFGVFAVVIMMVSSATAVPTTGSEPVMKKVSEFEKTQQQIINIKDKIVGMNERVGKNMVLTSKLTSLQGGLNQGIFEKFLNDFAITDEPLSIIDILIQILVIIVLVFLGIPVLPALFPFLIPQPRQLENPAVMQDGQ